MKSLTIDKPKRRKKIFSRDVDIVNSPVIGGMIAYTVPMILMNMLTSLYSAADIAVVGNLADKVAVASVGATATVIGLLVGIVQSVSIGYRVILARAMGQNDAVRTERVIKTGYTFSLILGVLVAVLGAVFTVPMLKLTGCPEDVIGGATQYMRIYMIGVPAIMFYTFNSCIISVKGDNVRPFIYSAISGAVNIVLNVVLVLLTGEAVVSVAVATVVSTYVSAALLLVKLIRLPAPYRVNPLKLNINGDVLRKIIKYGVPSMISSATFSFTNVQVQSAINSFGAAAISGNTSAISIEAFVFAITNSVGSTLSAFVGQCIGADKRERVHEIIKKSYILWGIVGISVSALLFFFGKNLLGIFIPGETEAIEFGAARLRYIAIATTMHAWINVIMGVLQGFGKTVYQMLVNIIGVCGFRLFWMLVIYPLSPTPDTLYMCYPISYGLIVLVGSVMVLVLQRKYRKGENFAL